MCPRSEQHELVGKMEICSRTKASVRHERWIGRRKSQTLYFNVVLYFHDDCYRECYRKYSGILICHIRRSNTNKFNEINQHRCVGWPFRSNGTGQSLQKDAHETSDSPKLNSQSSTHVNECSVATVGGVYRVGGIYLVGIKAGRVGGRVEDYHSIGPLFMLRTT